LRDYPARPSVGYTFLGKMNHFCGAWERFWDFGRSQRLSSERTESFCSKIFNKVAKSLVKILKLPLKDLENSGKVLEKVLIDVSEQETEKPKKNKKGSFHRVRSTHFLQK
jgi:hypothetical protein